MRGSDLMTLECMSPNHYVLALQYCGISIGDVLY